jgi:hypothetical protein
MAAKQISRRELSLRVFPALSAFALLSSVNALAADGELGISSGGDAIHQEVPITASRERI